MRSGPEDTGLGCMRLAEGIGYEVEKLGIVIVDHRRLAVADRMALLVGRAGSRHVQGRHTGPGVHHRLAVAGHIAAVGSLAVGNRPARSLAAVGSPDREVGTVGSPGCTGRRVLTF